METESINVIGVRFNRSCKTYYFDPSGFEVRKDDDVIVETARGVEFGHVVMGVCPMPEERIVQPLKTIIRVATDEDRERAASNREKEKKAYRICQEKIREKGLDMKLIAVEYTFNGGKILFYFTADGRVDFRELVKDLAAVFRTRIELRQIGVRDETRMLGGIGMCGRPLCCSTYLTDFAPVSIKMAKEQNLSLNPSKISGTCGRLMCCLRNEQNTYEYLNRKLPAKGDIVQTPTGATGEVSGTNVLRQTVKVLVEDGDEKELFEYPVEELVIRSRNKKKKQKSAAKGKNGEEKKKKNDKQEQKDSEEEKEPADQEG